MDMLSIDEIIRKNAECTPNKVAIECGEKKVTYDQLDKRSYKIANFLMDNCNEIKNIFVLMEKGISLIESVIGIMKSGGVFVPIDFNTPDNRIKGMLKEIPTNWIITSSFLFEKVNSIINDMDIKVNILLVEKDESGLEYKHKSSNVFLIDDYEVQKSRISEYSSNKHCYIYFTSGSTGKPKAVLGRYKSLMHFIEWEINEMRVTNETKVSQLTNISFDPFLRDVFVPLCAGGTLCIPENQDIILNPIKLAKWIEEKQITLIHIIPSLFKILSNEINSCESFKSLKTIILAGELLRGNDIRKFVEIFRGRIELVNLYGPTETTLAKVFYKIRKDDINKSIIPVGKPISFAEVLILDQDLEHCPTGVVGDIYIRTPFITSGYCNDKELTRKVFIKNPFSQNPNDIIYKTGDLGRRTEDDNVEVIGRTDNQVKIRGMRIDVGEIENVFLQHELVKEAIVIYKEDNKNLCAYITTDGDIDIQELKKYISIYLPDYMVPTYVTKIDKIPLNQNGKVYRKKLLEIKDDIKIEAKYIGPTSDVEKRLSKMWTEILKIERISIDSDFFELGGHSLKASQLMAEVYKEFNVEVSLNDIFEMPTIRMLSQCIISSEKNSYIEIERVEEREYYGLSSAQKRMFVLQNLELSSTRYNMPRIIVSNGKLHVEKLEQAFNKLISRHEVLRTSFHTIDGEIVQRICKHTELKIQYIESNVYSYISLDNIIKSFIKPFDLSIAPLLRVVVIKISEEEHIIIVDVHHIISDRTSMSIIVKELMELYDGKVLDELKIQYKDYVEWQNKQNTSENMIKQEQYWLDRFRGEIPILNMTCDYERPTIQSFDGREKKFTIDKELTNGLRGILKETSTTMHMNILSAFNILISKYSGQEDIIVGTPIAGRQHIDLKDIMGLFVNTLAMRNEPKGSKTYLEFLQNVKENALNAYENQNYQFETLVDKLNLRRELSRNPLFDVMFVMQNIDIPELEINNLSLRAFNYENNTSKVDLSLFAVEYSNQIEFSLEYSTKLYNEDTIVKMITHFKNILRQIVKNKNIQINEINMLCHEEENTLLNKFNNTHVDFQNYRTINELFKEQLEKKPNGVAVVYENNRLTYRILNEKANKLAVVLRKRGLNRNDIVGIMIESSIEKIIAILGVIKAGGACMPIDPEYPQKRVEYMLKDSNAKIVVTERELISDVLCESIVIDIQEEINFEVEEVENTNVVDDILYVVYTSGTTGNPKGIMVKHITLANLVMFQNNKTNIDFNTRVLQFTNLTFDVAFQEILSTLLNGGELHLIKRDIRNDIPKLFSTILNNEIEIVFLPTAFLKFIFTEKYIAEKMPKKIKHIITSGEQLIITDLLKKYLIENEVFLHNHYGPSETHVVTTLTINPQKEIKEIPSIGRPISGSNIYILSQNQKLQPVGVAGELCIGGKILAEGYLTKPDFTKEKFIDNPFKAGEKIYKTGDLAKWLPDGNIEFLGRIDHQVKIRGYRIELGEIENKLLKIQGLKECIVVDKNDIKANKYLCAYITGEKQFEVSEIRKNLSNELPDYMIPSYFIQINKLPLNNNGKVDRRLLPEPEGNINTGVEYEEPRSEKERIITNLWKQVLGLEKVGVNDNFFDLGGNSLKLIELNSKLNSLLNKEISLISLFRYPNIKAFVNYLESELAKNCSLSDELYRKDKMDKGKVRANQRMERMKKRGV